MKGHIFTYQEECVTGTERNRVLMSYMYGLDGGGIGRQKKIRQGNLQE